MDTKRAILEKRKNFATALRNITTNFGATLKHNEAESIIELLTYLADLLDEGKLHALSAVRGYMRTRTDSLSQSNELAYRNKVFRSELLALEKRVREENLSGDVELKEFGFMIQRVLKVIGINETRMTRLPCEGIDELTFVSLFDWAVKNPGHEIFAQRKERISQQRQWG